MENDNGKVLHIIRTNYRTIFEINKKRRQYKVDSIDIESLARQYKNLDQDKQIEALEIIIASNLPMVIAIMRNWYDMIVNEDTLQDLMSHLLEAIPGIVNRYNPESKNKFSTYLTSCLRGEAIKFLDTQRVIKYNYYYIVKKKGLEPISVSYESEIANMLDDGENALDIYSRYYSESSASQDNEENTERLIIINKIIEHLIKFIESKVELELDRNILKFYINNYLDVENSRSVHDIAKNFDVDTNYIYKVLRKTFREFRKYCEEGDNSELRDLYKRYLENNDLLF